MTDEDIIMPVTLHQGLTNIFDNVPHYKFVPITHSPGAKSRNQRPAACSQRRIRFEQLHELQMSVLACATQNYLFFKICASPSSWASGLLVVQGKHKEVRVWITLLQAWPLLLLVLSACGIAGIVIWAVVCTVRSERNIFL